MSRSMSSPSWSTTPTISCPKIPGQVGSVSRHHDPDQNLIGMHVSQGIVPDGQRCVWSVIHGCTRGVLRHQSARGRSDSAVHGEITDVDLLPSSEGVFTSVCTAGNTKANGAVASPGARLVGPSLAGRPAPCMPPPPPSAPSRTVAGDRKRSRSTRFSPDGRPSAAALCRGGAMGGG